MKPIDDFTTERLDVCHWGAQVLGGARMQLIDDLRPILTPAVLQHLPPSFAIDEVADWIDARAAECDVYLIKKQDVLIGLLILVADDGCLHLGYLLAENVWGQGFASEMLAGFLGVVPKGMRIVGGVVHENPASAHVLRKLGFTRDGARSLPHTDMFVLDT